MNFIHRYFKVKIGAIGKLIDAAVDAWNERIWLAFVLSILWAVFCTIGGMILLPIDFIYSAIMWHKSPEFREYVDTLDEALAQDGE